MNVGATPRAQILIADDYPRFAWPFRDFLASQSIPVVLTRSAARAVAIVDHNPDLHLAFVDSEIPPTGAIALMGRLHQISPGLSIIIVSTIGTPSAAVEAIKCGAEDYLVKPFNFELVVQKVARLKRLIELHHSAHEEGFGGKAREGYRDSFCISHVLRRVLSEAQQASLRKEPILLVGESGVGKDMLVRAIHAGSHLANGPFFLIDCRTLRHELAGREAFVPDLSASAISQANLRWMFNATMGGTVFLHEVGELTPQIQGMLIELLETIRGQSKDDITPVRGCPQILSSSSRPLSELREGRLDGRLYSLIAKVVLDVPPLRDRRDDIIPLIAHFLARLGRRYGCQFTLSWSSLELLMHYPFPGNVRELESILERTVAVSVQTPIRITDARLRPNLTTQSASSDLASAACQSFDLHRLEDLAVQRSLMFAKGNQTKAAALLGINRVTLYWKLRRLRTTKKEAAA